MSTCSVTVVAADVPYPHPINVPDSPLMLAGDWVPQHTSRITSSWAAKMLPRVPSQHSVVHDVRDANGTRVNQHNYLAFYGGRYWVMWSDGPGLSLQAFEIQPATSSAAGSPVWKPLGVVYDDSIKNFPPQKLPTGEWMMSRRNGKADVSVMIGGTQWVDKWDLIPMEAYEGIDGFKPEEPVWYTLPDNESLVFLFRDNNKSGFLFLAFSSDNGRTWTKPVRTNFPDATSKFSSCRLVDGRYVLVSNASRGPRDPLMLSISDDGLVYRQMGYLAGERQVDYPHVIEHDGHLLVAFASAKQSVEVLKINLSDLDILQPPANK